MKIVHVLLGKANPNRMNGVNGVVHALATAQRHAGVEAEVWGITRSPEADGAGRAYPLRVFPRSAPLRIDPSLRQALSRLGEGSLVHFHGGFIPDFYPLTRLLASRGRPYVLTPHGAYNRLALEKNWLIKRIYLGLFERDVVRGAAAVHCVGKSESLELPAVFGSLPWFLLPNGWTPEESETPEQEQAYRAGPVFGYCGRIDARTKGLDVLIEGFRAYRLVGGKGILWLIGSGPDSEWLRRRTGNLEGEAKPVTFFGELYGKEKRRLLSRMDVFVYPSRYEGFPMSVLEAAALGRPLLVTESTNVGDFVRRYSAGVVLRSLEAGDLARALGGLDDSWRRGELSRTGGNARKMIEEELHWDRIARDMVVRYRVALEGQEASSAGLLGSCGLTKG